MKPFAMTNNGLVVGIGVRKRLPNEADENKKSAVPTCDTGYPCGFQFVSEDSRFRSSADSRACLIGISVTSSPTCLQDLSDDINPFYDG